MGQFSVMQINGIIYSITFQKHTQIYITRKLLIYYSGKITEIYILR